ncbi:MAG: hypothetical protein BYD32DRAFT_414176 [Podila humilis]|nr:MAG: hypothetical protein BYD32DRAFT_414176 [Podila humilis]
MFENNQFLVSGYLFVYFNILIRVTSVQDILFSPWRIKRIRGGNGFFFLLLVVALDNAGVAEILNTLAHETFVADGECAAEMVLLLVKVGSTHVLEAALGDTAPRGLEGRDFALGVAVEGVRSRSRSRSRGGHGDGDEGSKGENGDLHGVFVCVSACL